MAKFTLAGTLLALGSISIASPTPSEDKVGLDSRFRALNEQWGSQSIGGGRYILYNNLFHCCQPGTSGSQTTQAYDYSGITISWKTQYCWIGNPTDVKSYANVSLKMDFNKLLSQIDRIITFWRWYYEHASSSLDTDVSYDLWLSNIPNSCTACSTSTIEVMIWLSHRQAEPSGSKITTHTIGGLTWDVFKGKIETRDASRRKISWDVYSFVATSELRGYHANLMHFFSYLNIAYGVSLTQYLVGVQAGTEAFEGCGTLVTTAYSTAVYSRV